MKMLNQHRLEIGFSPYFSHQLRDGESRTLDLLSSACKGMQTMTIRRIPVTIAKRLLPATAFETIRSLVHRPSRARRESNSWLLRHCANIGGKVLSIGSGTDADGEGKSYGDYFPNASSYTTSEVTPEFQSDLVLDVRCMPEIEDETYDCVFCSGVLEHVDEYQKGFAEITRILKAGGFLLLGLPFRQAIHMAPNDFWRFTEYAIGHLLAESYEIIELVAIDVAVRDFPATYLVKARKRIKAEELAPADADKPRR